MPYVKSGSRLLPMSKAKYILLPPFPAGPMYSVLVKGDTKPCVNYSGDLCYCVLCLTRCVLYAYVHLGRIDRKIEFPLPDEKTRRRIFQIHTKKMTLAEDLDLEEYITAKDDLSGADIKVKGSQ